MCEIHEARHYIYRRECLGEQDRGVWVLFVRNLLEDKSKWSASQASLHLLKNRLRGDFGNGFYKLGFFGGFGTSPISTP